MTASDAEREELIRGLEERFRPRTRAEAVAERLRERIRLGELAPGTPLRQVKVATDFGVSTTPVREAFRELVRQGLVRQDPHRGAVVFSPSLDEMAEDFEIRLALEPLAARHAARFISDETLGILDSLTRAIVEEGGNRRRHDELNRAFHWEINQAARRPRLAELIDVCRNTASSYMALVEIESIPGYFERIRTEHEQIIEGLRSRSPSRAARAMAHHLKSSSGDMAAAVAKHMASPAKRPQAGPVSLH